MSKESPVPPRPDMDCIGRNGYPVMRCRRCGTALELGIESYCWACGQKLVEGEPMASCIVEPEGTWEEYNAENFALLAGYKPPERREYSTSTYERAQKRLDQQIAAWMNGGKTDG